MRGFTVLRTSSRQNRLSRLADMMSTAWNCRNEYDIAQVDVYSGAAFFWAEAVCAVLRRAGRPYILTLHGGNLPRFASRWPGRVRRLLQSAHTVTAPSSYLPRALQAARKDIELLPNAIDLSRYEFRHRNRVKPRLVWMRAFHEVYNPSLAIRTLVLLQPDYPEAELLMAGPDKGDGSYQAAQALAKSLGVANRVSFGGLVPKRKVPQWLSQGDIFLNTPRIDNTPVTVLESMACGLCTVSTDVGGICDLVEDRATALLVPSDDPAAAAAAVRELVENSTLAESISIRGRRFAELLDWDVILEQWDKILARGLGRLPEVPPSARTCALL